MVCRSSSVVPCLLFCILESFFPENYTVKTCPTCSPRGQDDAKINCQNKLSLEANNFDYFSTISSSKLIKAHIQTHIQNLVYLRIVILRYARYSSTSIPQVFYGSIYLTYHCRSLPPPADRVTSAASQPRDLRRRRIVFFLPSDSPATSHRTTCRTCLAPMCSFLASQMILDTPPDCPTDQCFTAPSPTRRRQPCWHLGGHVDARAGQIHLRVSWPATTTSAMMRPQPPPPLAHRP
jgi:hypothetical protein